MNPFKKLASQTAIYGLPTIVGRLLIYLLNPIFTYNFTPAEIGIQSAGLSYTAFLLVLLTYGMETALFQFSQKEPELKQNIFSTALISVFTSSVLFIFIVYLLRGYLAEKAKFYGHPEYVVWFSIIIAADAFSAVSYAKLREQGKAKRFATIRFVNIGLTIVLNLFFILFCKYVYEADSSVFKPFVEKVFNPKLRVGYIFIINMIASLTTVVMLLPTILTVKLEFDSKLWKRMMVYALPLLIAGLAGTVNDTLDRILLSHLLPAGKAMTQIGIYSACLKLSIIMSIFIQAFRFAAEPFFFGRSKEKDSKEVMAEVLKFFVIICSLIFLVTMMNLQWLQYFIGTPEFRTGIKVVPILLLANMFLGIFWNQSIWFKLSGQTHFGAFLAIFGAIITIVLNFYWIPRIGYMGSAWATLICYASMMVASYFLGNKHYPVNYDIKRILGYLTLSITLYLFSILIKTNHSVLNLFMNNVLVVVFIAVIWRFEKTNLRKLV
ncbi:MAG TPA: oligosaccharide flippase family protein [Bacteroidia bacterium]|nr:oligosaccharide flippase family protein [Bacteroidia bacterium]